MTFSVKLALWKKHVQTAVTKLNAQFPEFSWGTYPGHDPSEALAADGMVPNYKTAAGKELGWTAARYVWANRVKLGIWYVIFDGKIISQTRPASGWLTYRPTAQAINNSPDSAYHRNHVHVSWYAAEPEVEYLPAHVVSAGCWAAHQTKPSKWRDVGYGVSTLVKIDGEWGRTESGYLYPMKYLAPKETPA